LKFLIKNTFLIVFFSAAFVYGYANIIDDQDFVFLTKFFLVPSLSVHYVTTSKQKKNIYILALLFASVGDLLFSSSTIDFKMMGIGCFILFNISIINLCCEKIGLFNSSKVILSGLPFFIIFLSIFLYLFSNDINSEIYLIILYFISLSLLCSFTIYYYLKTKLKAPLFILIGALLLFITNITKAVEYFNTAINIAKIINIGCYAASHYFFYKAMELKKV